MMDIAFYKYQLIEVLLAGAALLGWLTVVELLKRRDLLRAEAARKSVHIGAGVMLAILPLYMDRWQIILTNLGLFGGVLIFAGLFHVFTAIHAVKRWTVGEFIYPLSTALVAILFTDLRVYVFAVFTLAFADGLAGLLGRSLAKTNYQTIGGTKSWLGSAIFFCVVSVLLAGFWSVVHGGIVPVHVLGLAGLFMTSLEAGLAGGFDNLTVPLGAAMVARFVLMA